MSARVEPGPTSAILVDKAARWLLEQAVFDADINTLLAGCYERLCAAGIPLSRAHLVLSILHPLYSSLGVTWRPDEGVSIEGYQHFLGDEIPEAFRTSPYYQLKNQNIEFIRRRIEGQFASSDFPILKELATQGATDYLAFGIAFNNEGEKGVLGSWSTDRPGGFTESEIASLLNLNDALAVACKMAVQREVANNVVTTYLGTDAGHRVLNGNIKRGDGETTRAAIIYGDLRGSTAMADQDGRQAYIDALNDFFDATGGAISAQGGEVLSFIGDAFLAVYPCGRNRKESVVATQAALASSHDAIVRMHAINKDRETSKLAALRYGMSLHIGNVMFGNVGMPDRLAYSVFGATVNEAARLESLTSKYDKPVLGSHNFKDYAGGEWQELGCEELKGVARPMSIYAPA